MRGIHKGVYILPNLFTTANLLFGFMAIIQAIMITIYNRDNYKTCAILIFVAAIFDMIDGRVARKTNSASRFGLEYDSLADVVSFGVAPSIMIYLWGLRSMGRAGWIAVFLYLACGALRLARFNVQSLNVEKSYFQGLPIPMAAMMLVGSVLIWEGQVIKGSEWVSMFEVQWIILFLTYLLSILMVSTIPYRSFKSLPTAKKLPFYYMIFVVFVLMMLAFKPWWVVYLSGCVYLLWGPFEKLILKRDIRVQNIVQKNTSSIQESKTKHIRPL